MSTIKKIKDLSFGEKEHVCQKHGLKACEKCPLYIDEYTCMRSSKIETRLEQEVKI